MMKNVQGSSAGSGSGEFHAYKASRWRVYERLKQTEDESKRVHISSADSNKLTMSPRYPQNIIHDL
jgi:hypothetical protein